MLDKNKKTIKYITKKCSALTDHEIEKCSTLFSNHYGYYSRSAPQRAGQRIKLGKAYYEQLRNDEYSFVSLACVDNDIVGQAFYVLEETDKGYLSWITQLVVNENHRKQSIAKTLLFSVWGFSNDLAWGLATTNPLTIKTLESATHRKVSFSKMEEHIELIHKIAKRVSFVKPNAIKIDDHNATVDTQFYASHDTITDKIHSYGQDKWLYGELAEGHEWLAFVFQDQKIVMSPEELEQLLSNSSSTYSTLIDAYSRMQMDQHNWTKGTANEVDFITHYFTDKTKTIIDFGCGIGRHLFELKTREYHHLSGIDFSEYNIDYCKAKDNSITFEHADCRHYSSDQKYDYALCLYDVIGSFPDNADNIKILNALSNALTDGGIAIISVMNMELTQHIATTKINVYDNPQSLFKLKSSSTMQKTGDIFNPDYFIIDTLTGNVFRKEKFINDGGLSAEYIIRDKRYYREEIEALANDAGFDILESRFVRAGNWDTARNNIDPKAKEILLVLKKRMN